MTEDNTEVLFIQKYKHWDNSEQAEKRNKVLENKNWPDITKRQVVKSGDIRMGTTHSGLFRYDEEVIHA